MRHGEGKGHICLMGKTHTEQVIPKEKYLDKEIQQEWGLKPEDPKEQIL